MKRILLILLAFAVISVTACGETEIPAVPDEGGKTENPESGENNEEENNETNMENKKISLTVNGRSVTVTLVENSSTEALKERLAEGDISVRVDDYGDMEKVGPLGFTLPRNDVRTTTAPGDIILYQGNNIVFYYDTNSWSFTRLGHVDGVKTREEMLDLLGGKGEVTVELSIR